MLYMDPSNGGREVAPGVDFKKLEEMVSTLREQIIAPPEEQAPKFNFFGDASHEEDGSSAPTCHQPSFPDEGTDAQPPEPLESSEATTMATQVAVAPAGVSEQPAPALPGTNGNAAYPTLATPVAESHAADGLAILAPTPQNEEAAPSAVVAHSPVPVPAKGHALSGPCDGAGDSPTSAATGDDRVANIEERGAVSGTPHTVKGSQGSEAALPKREKRSKARSRPPAPAYPPPPTRHFVPQPRQGVVQGQALNHPHPHHGLPPFQSDQTPPLTPLQVGPGLVPPVPSPSPPPAPPSTLPAGNSPNLPYGAGWGYAQPPPPPHMVLPQAHPHQPPQSANGPPIHHLAASTHPDAARRNVPWVNSPVPSVASVYAGHLQKVQATSPHTVQGGKFQQGVPSGFGLGPEHAPEMKGGHLHVLSVSPGPILVSPHRAGGGVQVSPNHAPVLLSPNHPTSQISPSHLPVHMPHQPPPISHPPQGTPPGHWGSAQTMPPPPPPSVAKVVDLEKGMGTWQADEEPSGTEDQAVVQRDAIRAESSSPQRETSGVEASPDGSSSVSTLAAQEDDVDQSQAKGAAVVADHSSPHEVSVSGRCDWLRS